MYLGYLGNYGYGWSDGAVVGNAAYLPFAMLTAEDLSFRSLPEEVREALEARKDEIHTAEDLRRLANELMQRK